jgi:hypothetical protein
MQYPRLWRRNSVDFRLEHRDGCCCKEKETDFIETEIFWSDYRRWLVGCGSENKTTIPDSFLRSGRNEIIAKPNEGSTTFYITFSFDCRHNQRWQLSRLAFKPLCMPCIFSSMAFSCSRNAGIYQNYED